jgi:hypothetical protein
MNNGNMKAKMKLSRKEPLIVLYSGQLSMPPLQFGSSSQLWTSFHSNSSGSILALFVLSLHQQISMDINNVQRTNNRN